MTQKSVSIRANVSIRAYALYKQYQKNIFETFIFSAILVQVASKSDGPIIGKNLEGT